MHFSYSRFFCSLIILILFSCSSLRAQDQSIADSLTIRLQEEEVSDSLKYVWLYNVSFNDSDVKVKLDYAKLLQERAASNENEFWLLRGLFLEGTAHRLAGDLASSIQVYFKCEELAKKLFLTSKVGEVYNELANVCSVAGDHVRALNYYKKAIAILREGKDSLQLAATLTNMGDEYYNVNRLDSALILFEESGLIFEIHKNRSGAAYNLGNIGLVYAKQNQHELAEKTLKEATRILNELGDQYAVAIFETYMADVYLKKGDLSRALTYSLKSHQISLLMGLKEQVRDASSKLSQIYASLGDFEEAYEYQKQYIAYRDSINSKETIRKMADLRTEFEVSQKQVEIDLLESRQRTQNIMFISMASTIILLAFLAFMYYRNNRRKQVMNLILTERKEEIEAQRDQLEAMNETREKFLSIIAHDLLGPVNSFKGFSTIMKMSIDQNDVKDLEELHVQFDKSINGLSTLLGTLLDWSVTQQGNIPYQPQKVNLQDVADELVSLFMNMASTKQITIKSDILEPIYLWVDLNSVKTILRNLVSNAIKFTSEGGHISVSAAVHGSMATISVKDTGIGMSADKIQALLKDNDYQRSWGTKGEKGLGLGLQLVKEFAQMNKGTVDIDSTEGIGTTITVSLPLWQPELVEVS